MAAGTFRDLTVYKKAFALAMEIFKKSKKFPSEEKYSLTDQVRRSSRSVCACVGEAYRKRQYKAYFVSKSSDADMENTETRVWLDFALACEYITKEEWTGLDAKAEEAGKLLNHMIENPEKYFRKTKPR
ncbi:MAG: four helix bundle protein [Cyclobacteriaceae bacterium]|nr:four helix bundle protein [Cyclobacteriaceae bacterium]